MRVSALRCANIAWLLACLQLAALAQPLERAVAPGITLIQEASGAPLVVTALRVDLRAPEVRIAATVGDAVYAANASRGRETPSAAAELAGAVAAVNADFFPFTGDPLGLTIRDGELLSEPSPNRAAFGVLPDGRCVFGRVDARAYLQAGQQRTTLHGVNRAAAANEICLLTPSAGGAVPVKAGQRLVGLQGPSLPLRAGVRMTAAAGPSAPADPAAPPAPGTYLLGDGAGAQWLESHYAAGQPVAVQLDLAALPLPGGTPSSADWNRVRTAVGGGPWLLRDGKVAIDGAEAGFSQSGFVDARHPRTAVGVTADGSLLLVVADGRQRQSRGVSLPELADVMRRLGAVDAINLDGGGSSALAVRGLYVNSPSDGSPRPVASSLLVFGPAAAQQPAELAPEQSVAAGVALDLAAAVPGVHEALWGTVDGRGFVDQRGRATTTRAGTFTAAARVGTRLVTIPVRVVPGPPASARLSLGAVANNPPDRSSLTVTVTDRFGNPVPNVTVRLRGSGGQPDPAQLETDARGRAIVEVVWDDPGKGAVEASVDGVKPARISNRPPSPGP